MIITLLAVIALLIAAIVGVLAIFTLVLRRFINDFRDFVSPAGETDESPASILYGVLIKRLATELKVTIMGAKGGEAKGQAYAEQAIMQEVVTEQNPLLGSAMSIPAVSKLFRKQPALLEFVLSKLGTQSRPGSSPAAHNNDGGGFASNPNKYA